MSSEYAPAACKALINEVVRCIGIAQKLDDNTLIDCGTIKRDNNGKLTFGLHENGFDPEEDVYFHDRGTFQNNLAFIVGQLQVFNRDASRRTNLSQVRHIHEKASMFNGDDVSELMKACKDITSSEVPALVGMIEGVRLVDVKGYKD